MARRSERCGCGKVWSGWGDNPSLECDKCYPPSQQSFEACVDCKTPLQHRTDCLYEEDAPTLGEIGHDHEPYCFVHGFNCDMNGDCT